MKGAFGCVPDPTFLLIHYPDTRKSPTVGDGGVDGMIPIGKTQLFLICSFLPHPGLNSWAFPLACKSAKTTSPVTADQCQTPGDIRSFHFVPLDRGWWKVRGSWCLKILNQSISLTGQCSFFILSASSISAGSATPPPVPSLTTLFHGFLADAHYRPAGLALLLPCCTQRDRGSGRWIRCRSWDTVMLLCSEGLCSFNCSVEVLLWAFTPTVIVHFSIIQRIGHYF